MDVFFMLCFAVVAYMFPWIVSLTRLHRQATAIFALNLLTGWSVVGWIGCCVWACTANTEGN